MAESRWVGADPHSMQEFNSSLRHREQIEVGRSQVRIMWATLGVSAASLVVAAAALVIALVK
jgi:hypothetical protein